MIKIIMVLIEKRVFLNQKEVKMDKLFELGINDNDLRFILEQAPGIFNMSRVY